MKPQRRDAEYYTGSIIIVPARKLLAAHDRQSHRKNVGQGYVNCYEAVSPQEKDQRVGTSSLRMNAIGKAFNRGGDN